MCMIGVASSPAALCSGPLCSMQRSKMGSKMIDLLGQSGERVRLLNLVLLCDRRADSNGLPVILELRNHVMHAHCRESSHWWRQTKAERHSHLISGRSCICDLVTIWILPRLLQAVSTSSILFKQTTLMYQAHLPASVLGVNPF